MSQMANCDSPLEAAANKLLGSQPTADSFERGRVQKISRGPRLFTVGEALEGEFLVSQ